MTGNYHGDIFIPYCGATQGGIVSPILFNVLVDAVVRKWLVDVMADMTLQTQVCKVTTLVVCPHYSTPMTAQLYPWIMNGSNVQISTSATSSEIVPV